MSIRSARRVGLRRLFSGFWLLACLTFGVAPASAQADGARSVVIELYHRGVDAEAADAIAAVRELKTARGGITLVLRDVAKNEKDQARLTTILRHFGVAQKTLPIVYGLNRVLHDVAAPDSWAARVRELLQVEVFVRTGCSRCASAKAWLPSFMKDYPALELVYRDAATDPAAAARMSSLVARHKAMAVSVPVFHLCDSLVIGFDARGSTEERLRSTLKMWTHPPRASDEREPSRPSESRPGVPPRSGFAPPQFFSGSAVQDKRSATRPPFPGDEPQDPSDEGLPLPTAGAEPSRDAPGGDDVDLPLFGRLSAGTLGMPLFTIAVGLVDGFNPCAMWVLLFLLSILVNLKDRLRILAIAGTFVVISGAAYFAFMAAWLNIFMLIGYLRPIQVCLAVLAIAIGAVHVKDFFAFKKGISFSIPESAKPRIYARVRGIVTAEHMAGAVVGAITLAVLVNAVELLCTSGLPALYTSILMQQGYSAAQRYAYLALYIAAYMLDDTLMVLGVVLTLSKVKMQESSGRWLKLLSGAAIVLLGIIMLVRPEWLA